MGLSVKNFTKKVIHFEVLYLSQDICINMVDSVETTTPTVEVAANGASENETEEVSETTAADKTVETENGDTTKEATNGKETETEKEATNGKETETEKVSEEEEKVTSNKEETSTEEVAVEGEEATKRKADSPSEDETVEKIAKLKETAAEVVSEAEKKLPEEPLTEAEATAEATA